MPVIFKEKRGGVLTKFSNGNDNFYSEIVDFFILFSNHIQSLKKLKLVIDSTLI